MFVKQTSFEILVCLRVSCLGAGLSFDLVIARMKEGYISDFGTIHHHSITGNESKSISMLFKITFASRSHCISAKKRYNGNYTRMKKETSA